LARRADGRYEVDLDAFSRGSASGRASSCSATRTIRSPCLLARRADESSPKCASAAARDRGRRDPLRADLGSHRHTPIASLDPEIADRTITLMAPSKTFNLAGLKCSVAVIPNATLREKFIAGRIDLVQTVNVFGYTRPSPPTRRPALARRAPALISKPTATSSPSTCGRACPEFAMSPPEAT